MVCRFQSSSFSRSKAGSRASLKSTDKHRSSDHSKVYNIYYVICFIGILSLFLEQ